MAHRARRTYSHFDAIMSRMTDRDEQTERKNGRTCL